MLIGNTIMTPSAKLAVNETRLRAFIHPDNELLMEELMLARKKATKRAPKKAIKKVAAKKTGARKISGKKTSGKKWSGRVTETSDAMTLQKSVFKKTPRAIALSLKRSAERSHRRKSAPFRSAMSMLNFYINRAGKNLSASERAKLEAAKKALRGVFHRDEAA